MNQLILISLEHCPYSIAAKELLDNMQIKHKYILVTQSEKYKYKNNEINTFPQIYYQTKNKKHLIGGYNDIKTFIDFIKDNDLDSIKKEYSYINKKVLLRLIKLFKF